MKLFRYIVPIFFLFCSVAAVAQMDKDGNFHWDELYTPDEVLELDMSLPNKVEVSAIKNRERVKYVKLRCYPWIEHIPFTPEDFPNIEALRIETYLLVDLRNLELFTGLKRLGVTEPNCMESFIRVIQNKFPQPYANRVWSLSALEEIDFSIGNGLMVSKNSLSKLSNLHCLNNKFCGAYLYDEVTKLQNMQRCNFVKTMFPIRKTDRKIKQGSWKMTYYCSDRFKYYHYSSELFKTDSIYECVLHLYNNNEKDTIYTSVYGYCWISDTILITQYGLISCETRKYIENRTACIYNPSEEKLILLDFDALNNYHPYYFLMIDFRKKILISYDTEDDCNYVIEENKVFVNDKYSLGYPNSFSWGEGECKEKSEPGHEFDYFELFDDTLKISELKKAQMLDSYKKEYEKQIEFAKSLKSLECIITNYNRKWRRF